MSVIASVVLVIAVGWPVSNTSEGHSNVIRVPVKDMVECEKKRREYVRQIHSFGARVSKSPVHGAVYMKCTTNDVG